ncbi:MAG: hypothetical protein HOM25_08620 [Rhodospirillaceae bacterium]|jgi:Ca2+-binding EF-hand superfamily protein|nr:hypothetical protein [Rhodospirillaceae bacterium]MBT5666771.1 hypothetical protein [Rhodospirillaceae bacterium]MBT5812608.1 hypothetical protein [Rhodospirillaceae bacterium]
MKRSTKIITVAAMGALGLAALASTSIASGRWSGHQQGNHHMTMGMSQHGYGSRMMDRFDTDGDGKITKAEMATFRDEAMAKYDADKDGNLSLDEFQGVWLEHMQPRMVRKFQHLDSDGDAKVSSTEINNIMQRMMSHMDRNDDDVISKDDMRGRGGHHNDRDDDDRRRGPKHD